MKLISLNQRLVSQITVLLCVIASMQSLSVTGATVEVSNQAELYTAITNTNINLDTNETIIFLNDIPLTAALPVIGKGLGTLTIEGRGYVLSRNSETEFRLLEISGGNISVFDLTISGGLVPFAGGVYNSFGNLTMNGCTISNNAVTGGGGGVYNGWGNTTLIGCSITNNSAGYAGGGFYHYEGSLELIDCVVSGNISSNGGGFYVFDGTLELTESTVMGNTSTTGGGILLRDGTVELTGCTLSGNTATSSGGGFGIQEGSVVLENCTVSGNTANTGNGGGFAISEGLLTLLFSTVTGNAAPSGPGGGISNHSGEVRLSGSLIAGNSALAGMEINNGEGLFLANAYNLFGYNGLTNAESFLNFTPGGNDVVCTSNGSSPFALAMIVNSTLADNGGPTLTHALLAGSPAIDIVASGSATDQRGVARPQGTARDAGSFEFDGENVTPEEPEAPTEPEARFEEYWHYGVANTINSMGWNLDPSNILDNEPENTMASGILPRGFSIVGKSLGGTFSSLGTYAFAVVSRSGIHEVRNHFLISVIPPTLTPLIAGLWVNGVYHPSVIMEERTHGDAAITELISLQILKGQPLELKASWDYIKDDSSWRIIRGKLPQGLVLREQVVNGFPSATIEGVPTQTGEFIFVISVLDWRGRGYQWIRLVVE